MKQLIVPFIRFFSVTHSDLHWALDVCKKKFNAYIKIRIYEKATACTHMELV